MKLAINVHYEDNIAYIAGIYFDSWQDESPQATYTSKLSDIEDYMPGSFYKRELPCIMHLISEHKLSPELILVDGYVFLDGHSKAGLGKHLYDLLDNKIPVIGVAKKSFTGIGNQYELYRGKSTKPLFITSIDIETEAVKKKIKSMHGKHRIPTLLKKADQLCRKKN